MLELKDIKKIYNPGTVSEICLFDGFSLSVEEGSFVSIVGSNGSGKTSILNIVCGSIGIDSGEILLDGQRLNNQKEYRRHAKIGRVYQNPAVGTCASMTILENLALADNKNKRYGLTRGTNKKRIAYYQEKLRELGLGLEDKLEAPAGTLSGGQRQALALIMSTLSPIDFLILDEHTAALDPKTAELIMELTQRIVDGNEGLTTIMVTHNLRYAVEYGDRLLMMHQGEAVLDVAGEMKRKTSVDDILGIFTEISIELGN